MKLLMRAAGRIAGLGSLMAVGTVLLAPAAPAAVAASLPPGAVCHYDLSYARVSAIVYCSRIPKGTYEFRATLVCSDGVLTYGPWRRPGSGSGVGCRANSTATVTSVNVQIR